MVDLPTSYSPAEVAAAQVACAADHGPIDPATTVAEIGVRLAGGWWLCSEPNVFLLTEPLAFTTDGRWYRLKPTEDGGLVREQGIDHEGTYKIDPQTLWIDPGPFQAKFETSPRRFQMTVATSGFKNWYVPLGAH
jgi:hypothetical protein